MKKNIAIILSILLSSYVSFAYSAGWVHGVTISNIYPYDLAYTGILVQTTQTHSNPDSCSTPSFYIFPADGPISKEMFSLLLQATSMNKSVDLYLSGCLNNHPKLVLMQSKF